MTLTIHIVKHTPLNIEKIILEDVASYMVTDSLITVKFNGTPDEQFFIVNTEQEQRGEWMYMDISHTRIGLQLEGGRM